MNKTQKHLVELITRDVICFISQDCNLSVDSALETFFISDVFDKLQDIETGLYTESASYIYEIFKNEHSAFYSKHGYE